MINFMLYASHRRRVLMAKGSAFFLTQLSLISLTVVDKHVRFVQKYLPYALPAIINLT